jgi:Tol biopolymer transport system component
MAEPKNEKNRQDELFWLFPVLMVAAILAITIVVKPSGCAFGVDPHSAGPVPAGAPHGTTMSVYQGESVVVVPTGDNSGIRTLDQLAELLQNDIYTAVDEPVGEGTYTDCQVPGPGLKIVIRSEIEDEGNADIYMLDETGYNPVRLTDWESTESFPAIAPAGNRVYFASDRDDDPNNPNPFTKNTEIYYVDLLLFGTPEYEGSVRLTYNNETDYGIGVSSDASRIVYMSATKTDPENPVLILADGDCRNGRVIANSLLKNSVPKISGDGNYVVYNSFLDGEMDIYLYDVQKDFTVNLTNSDIPEYFPGINYDGSMIVYEKLLHGTPQDEQFIELYACDRNGENERQITMNRFADTFPAVSDDGKWIAFVSKRWDFSGDGHYDEALFFMDSQGQEVWKITKDPFYEEQPDM